MVRQKQNRPKNFIRKSRAKKSRKTRKQRGGKIVMAQRYFNPNFNNHYHTQEQLQQMGNVNPHAVSHGSHNGTPNTVGPILNPQMGLNMTGGGVLPAEYFGGNSGRYFAEGSPELQNCTTAYGVAVPTSHGVVMGGENAGWMGPNLGPFPHFADMTGGSRRRRKTRKNKKSRSRKSRGRKSKGRKSKGRK
jgi:hypothetical protein